MNNPKSFIRFFLYLLIPCGSLLAFSHEKDVFNACALLVAIFVFSIIMLKANRNFSLQTKTIMDEIGRSDRFLKLSRDIISQCRNQFSDIEKHGTKTIDLINDNLSHIVQLHAQINNKYNRSDTTAEIFDNLISSNESQIRDLQSKIERNKALKIEQLSAIQNMAEQIFHLTELSRQVVDLMWRLNILSLNAHIESIRAGEDGKSFSIIANELRQLAIHSSQETELIINTTNQLNLSITRVLETAFSNEEASETEQQWFNEFLSKYLTDLHNKINQVSKTFSVIKKNNKIAEKHTLYAIKQISSNSYYDFSIPSKILEDLL